MGLSPVDWRGGCAAGLAVVGGARRGVPAQDQTNRRLEWRYAAVASWTAWVIANGFSTLSEVSALWAWWLPVAVAAFWGLPWRRGILLAGVAMGLALGLVWGVSTYAEDNGLNVQMRGDYWLFSIAGQEPQEQWLLLPDERVLGLVAGREARRLALARPGTVVWMPRGRAPFVDQGRRLDEWRSPARHMAESPVEAVVWERILQVGGAMIYGDAAKAARWRIHPLGRPAENEAMVAGVLLPTLAGTGDLYAWRKWAEAHDVPIMRTGVAGLDIRARWPGVLSKEALFR